MADWKYVMFADKNGVETPILFPGSLAHKDVADAIVNEALRNPKVPYITPVSAGFIPALQILSAEGMSETLRMHSKPEDTKTINCMPYSHGRKDGMDVSTLLLSRFVELALKELNKRLTISG